MQFSVIMATHNNENTIERAIRSVMSQVGAEWELQVINDGSTDGTAEIVDRLVAQDARIHLTTQAAAGVSVARNRGLRAANGAYILFLDADDWFEKDSFAQLERALVKSPDILIFNCYNATSQRDRRPADTFGADADWTSTADLQQINDYCATQFAVDWPHWYGSLHNVWGRCYRRAFLQANSFAFDPKLRMSEDWCFNLAVFAKAQSVSIRNLYLYNYYANDASVMHTNRWEGHDAYMQGFRAIAALVPTLGRAQRWLPYMAFDQLHDEILLIVNSRLGFLRGAAEIRRVCRSQACLLAIRGIDPQLMKPKNRMIFSWMAHKRGLLLWASFYYRYRLKV